MRLDPRARASRAHTAALLLAAALLLTLVAPVMAAGNDNNVEWNGLGHLGQPPAPVWQLCDDSSRLYRQPGNPRADQAVNVRATAYPLDLTSLNVWYTTNAAATAQADWTALPAAYEAGDVLCSRGTVAPWKATIPATGQQVWYKIQYVDGSSVAWQRQPGEGAAPISNSDGGWTTASTTLTYQAPTSVFVDDDYTSATPGWGYDHFATLTEGVAAVATGATVNVAAGAYPESVTLGRAVSLLGAQADVAVAGRTVGGAAEATVTGQFTIDAANVTLNGFTLTNPGAPYAVVVNPTAANATITRNLVDNVGATTLAANVHAVIAQNGADGLRILDNRFSNINAGAKSLSAVGILDSASTDASEGLMISGNTFTGITSAGKGAYAVILNNKAGVPGAQITNNSFSNLSGGWTHAIGLETRTPNAVVTGNSFTGLTATGADNAAVHFEDNPDGATAGINHNNFGGGGYYGVLIHPDDLPGGANGLNYTVNAEENWWNSGCGPTATGVKAGQNVDYMPWWLQSGGPALGSTGSAGEYVIPTGATTADGQAVFDCAAPDSVVTFAGGTYPGGYVINTNGLRIKLNGATIGHGSPAFTVNADDVVIQGGGTLDGQGASDAGVLVNAGADNFTLRDATVTGWQDGVRLAGDVVSFKLFGNYIHGNSRDGLHVDAGAGIDGVINIDGNLFKNNTGAGVNNAGDTANLNVQFNSWGDLAGPTGPNGDGTAGSVDAANFTFIEPFMDMVPDTLAANVGVIEGKSFNAALKVDAARLYGFTFKVTYDPAYLTLNSTTFSAPWSGRCSSLSAVTGVISYRCQLLDPTPAVNATAGTVATFNFTVAGGSGNGPWTSHLDISHLVTDTSAAATGGSKIFVNNAGYGAPSAAGRSITDTDDGSVTITGIAQYKGFVDLQGRTSEAGATVKVWNQAAKTGATQHAEATSAASGAYTTAYVAPQVMTVGTEYWMVIDRRLFLATTANAATSYSHSKFLTTRPTTTLATVVLLGGDATDDELIDVNDAGCIGGSYAAAPVVCGTTGTSDVNEDGLVDILDLSLMGGNYGKTSSIWTP